MDKKLFIIESGGKISKIRSFLPKQYQIIATMGHIRDLDRKSMSIDFNNHFEPQYQITRPDVVRKIKNEAKNSSCLYIGTDIDFEGEAIAQSVHEICRTKKYLRVRFNQITKKAIEDGINEATTIDQNFVSAQKARKVIDRLYGYLLSPLVSKKISGHLSVGRVQSPSLRLIVEREEKINAFHQKNGESVYQLDGIFSKIDTRLYQSLSNTITSSNTKIEGNLVTYPENAKKIVKVLKRFSKSKFVINHLDSVSFNKPAPPPFITATLQIKASNRFKFGVNTTMRIAQQLYEKGYITYHRTDSIQICSEALKEIKQFIITKYGKKYYHKNVFKNGKNSQEAHEAIRPTDIYLTKLTDTFIKNEESQLYQMIWERTVASQMAPMKISKIIVQIKPTDIPSQYFQGEAEKVVFEGYCKVYEKEKKKDHQFQILSKIKVGNRIKMDKIEAKQHYPTPPLRYSEALLVKKLKDLGIGRPSTYGTIIKTLIDRKYITLSNIPAIKKTVNCFWVLPKDSEIYSKQSIISVGGEKNKLCLLSLGSQVNQIMESHFSQLIDYQFTANLEKQMEKIAKGKVKWYQVVEQFYQSVNQHVTIMKKGISDARCLGKDNDGVEIWLINTPSSGVVVRKLFENGYRTVSIEGTVTLEKAINLLEYPKIIGNFRGIPIWIYQKNSKYYLVYEKKYLRITDPASITTDQGIKIIKKDFMTK